MKSLLNPIILFGNKTPDQIKDFFFEGTEQDIKAAIREFKEHDMDTTPLTELIIEKQALALAVWMDKGLKG